MKFYADGSGWNGRESGFCVISSDGFKKIEFDNAELTNNSMEYIAVIKALELCNNGDEIYTDSRLIFGQMIFGWKINKPELRLFKIKACELMIKKNAKIFWIPREENLAGIELENHKRY